jgi:inner membrane protein
MTLEWLQLNTAWGWGILGVLLMVLELLAPASFMLWIGLAALITAFLVGVFGLSWQAAFLVFGVLCVASVLLGKRLMGQKAHVEAGATFNDRGALLVGQTFALSHPIVGGVGQLKIADSVWRITGVDAPIGTQIRVDSLDGTTLVVKKV